MGSTYYETSGAIWFKAATCIGSGVVLGVSITNTYYYYQIQNGADNAITGTISKGTATTLFWINLIVAFIAGIIFLWSLVRLFFAYEYRLDTTSTTPVYAASTYKDLPSTFVQSTQVGYTGYKGY